MKKIIKHTSNGLKFDMIFNFQCKFYLSLALRLKTKTNLRFFIFNYKMFLILFLLINMIFGRK